MEMNSLTGFFLSITLMLGVWMIVSMVRIQEFLRARGHKVNFLLLGVMIFDYMAKYKAITVQERGRPGILYYHFIIAANGALLSAILAAVLKTAA
jgi:hypothetical protein